MNDLSRSQTKALKEQRADLAAAYGHEPTRRVLRRLLDACGVFSYNPSTDNAVFYTEGQRSVGLWLIAELNAIDVHALPRLLQEGANEAVVNHAAAKNMENQEDDD